MENGRPPRSVSAYALQMLVLLAGFALRLVLIDQRPVWYDEAFSVFLAQRDPGQIMLGTAADIQPPLYYLLLHIWQVLGDQAFVVRFLSVTFSLVSATLAFALARKLFGQTAGFLTFVFVAVAPFQIYYAQELRMYSLLELSLLGYAIAFVQMEKSERATGPIIALAACGAAALYTQSLAFLTWIVPDLYLLHRRDVRLLKRLLVGQGLSLLLFLPWLTIMMGQMTSVQRSYWISPPGIAEAFQLMLAFTTSQPLPAWLLPIALFATLAAIVVLTLAIVRPWRVRPPQSMVLVVMFWIVPPAFMFALSYAFRSIFVVRGVILSTLAFAMLWAWFISRIQSNGARTALAAVSIVLVLPAIWYQVSYSEFPRSPYAQAAFYLTSHVKNGDIIIHDNKMTYFPMRYYEPNLPQLWIADPPAAGSNTLSPATMQALDIFPSPAEQVLENKARVWFVIFQRALDESASEGQPQGNLSWMVDHFTQTDLVRFNDLNVYVYQK